MNTAFLNQSGLAVGDTATVNIGTAQVTVRIVGEVFQPRGTAHVRQRGDPAGPGERGELLAGGRGAQAGRQRHRVRPGGQPRAAARRSPFVARRESGGQFYSIAIALIGLLSLMVAVAAASACSTRC